jgi:hypothetical protein
MSYSGALAHFLHNRFAKKRNAHVYIIDSHRMNRLQKKKRNAHLSTKHVSIAKKKETFISPSTFIQSRFHIINSRSMNRSIDCKKKKRLLVLF